MKAEHRRVLQEVNDMNEKGELASVERLARQLNLSQYAVLDALFELERVGYISQGKN